MILLDYSAVAISSMMVSLRLEGEKLTDFFALHMILNSIRTSNKRHSSDFGEMIICCDDKRNWRKDIFPYYKYKRRKDKEESDVDWDLINKSLNYVKDELKNSFPYLVDEVPNAEADDIIGALATYATKEEIPTVIVSNDKDFVQLHSEYVCQYRPCESAFIRHPNPKMHLKELILRGDKEDGIPNIKTCDEHFTLAGKRQKSMFAKEMSVWLPDDELTFLKDDEMKKRYDRNEMLIDLSFTPESIREEAVRIYKDNIIRPNKPEMVKFFMKNRLRNLHTKINDFM